MSNTDPYETPASSLDESNIAPGSLDTHLAGRGARLGAAIIDGVIAGIVSVPIMFATGVWGRAMNGTLGIVDMLLVQILGIAVYLLIHGKLLASSGQTVGKKLVGVKIVDHQTEGLVPLKKIVTHRLLPIWAATLVPVVGNILVLVDSLFIFRNDRRCLHDQIANTKVVYASAKV